MIACVMFWQSLFARRNPPPNISQNAMGCPVNKQLTILSERHLCAVNVAGQQILNSFAFGIKTRDLSTPASEQGRLYHPALLQKKQAHNLGLCRC
ncbi:MAG: hypothetical protein WC340_02785, partial [Kiritimatiellia bacterium]